MRSLLRALISATTIGMAMLASPASAQLQAPYRERTYEGSGPGVYFSRYFPRDQHRSSVIIVFDRAAGAIPGVAALLVTQTVSCETRHISTEHFAAYGADGGVLQKSQNLPAETATAIHAETWQGDLLASCNPPPPPPPPGFAVDPPPAYDRRFDGEVMDAAEAIALIHARADARVQAQALSQDGRWGTFIGRQISGGAYIDYADGQTDAQHMSLLLAPGLYERNWRYARARYSMDCATHTAFVEYLVLYDDNGGIVSISGPTQKAPMSLMLAHDTLAQACASSPPRGPIYTHLSDAVAHLRADLARSPYP